MVKPAATIRERERSCASSPDGLSQSWTEYQVVVGRRIVSRHDTRADAERAASEATI